MTGWIPPAFVKSIRVPGVDPTAPGAVCIQVHPDWIPYIAGALEPLRQAALWEGTAAEIETATRQAANLLDLVASATTCPTGGEDTPLDYIHIRDKKSNNVNAGNFTAGAWQRRELTEIVTDTGSFASLTGNQITLAAGRYEARITCPAYQVNRHKGRLQDVTNGVTLAWGTSAYAGSADGVITESEIRGEFVLTASTVLEVQHMAQTSRSTIGLGVASNFTTDEIYTVAELWRVGD